MDGIGSTWVIVLLGVISACAVILAVVVLMAARAGHRLLQRTAITLRHCDAAIQEAHRTLAHTRQIVTHTTQATAHVATVVHRTCDTTSHLLDQVAGWTRKAQALFGVRVSRNHHRQQTGARHQERSAG